MIAKCPGCGAPPAPDATVCRYCNSPLNAPQRGPSRPAAAAPTGSIVGALVGFMVVASMVAGASFWVRNAAAPGGPASGGGGGVFAAKREYPNELLAVLPDKAGPRDDAFIRYHHDDKYWLARLDGAALTPVWTSATGDRSSSAAVVHDDKAVYLAVGERLRAHELADGRPRWDVGLVAELQYPAHLRLVGDSVVAWQKDKSLQAFDVATGAVRWTSRTSDTSDRLPVVAGKLVREADGDPRKLVLVDPHTGVAGPPAAVHCREQTGSQNLAYDDLQLADTTPDGSALVLALGVFDLCLIRFDPATNKPVWTTPLKDRIRVGWSEKDALRIEATDVFLAGDDVLLAVDIATGKQRDIAREPEVNFRLKFVHEDTLLAFSWPDHDSSKLTLRAFARDGTPRWQHRLIADDYSGRDWGLAGGPGTLFLWQSSDEEKVVILERLDMKTGAVSETREIGQPSSIAPSLYGYLSTPRRAWYIGIGEFATIDLVSGAVEAI